MKEHLKQELESLKHEIRSRHESGEDSENLVPLVLEATRLANRISQMI